MAKNATILRVFLSCPNDMAPSRDVIRRAAEELNRSDLIAGDIRLEVITWESHATPGFGDDAQSILNEQLADWDIYIGILGTTFGTPTHRAESGTEEEFNNAYGRWKKDNRSCRNMFYFSEALVPPSQIDPEQIAKVQSFKKTLGDLGGLYWVFREPTELAEVARRHLTKTIAEYGRTWGPMLEETSEDSPTQTTRNQKQPLTPMESPVSSPTTEMIPENNEYDTDEDTLLDLVADVEGTAESLASSLTKITSSIDSMNKTFNEKGSEIAKLNDKGGLTARKLRAYALSAAKGMENMAFTVKSELPQIRHEWRIVEQTLFSMLGIADPTSQTDRDTLKHLDTSFAQVEEVFLEAVSQGTDLPSTLSELGKYSRDLRKAAKKTAPALRDLLTEFQYIVSQVGTFRLALKHKLDGPEKSS